MELKMKAICEGRKTRAEVVAETVEQYREVYIRTQQRIDLLQAVSGQRSIKNLLLTEALPRRCASTCLASKAELLSVETGVVITVPRSHKHFFPLYGFPLSVISQGEKISGSIHHVNTGF